MTSPGTADASPPSTEALPITWPRSSSLYMSGAAAAGAVGRKSMTTASFMLASLTTMKPPPPMPDAFGSRTPRANPVATAASTALPPIFSMSMPTRDASGFAAATTPFAPVAPRP